MKSKLKPRLTLQQILNKHLDELIDQGCFNRYQIKILRALQYCKTAELGGHWQACNNCGVVEKYYNSCGNRHCPGCQGVKREDWILKREQDLFDVPHHHITFTVPAELRDLFRYNKKLLYNLLFYSMKQTLLSFAKDKRSRLMAEIGIISILHTWTQKLQYHPHLHCIVPSGGLTAEGKWKAKSSKYLFYVKNLSGVYKEKFCDALLILYQENQLLIPSSGFVDFDAFVEDLKQKKWVVNSKPGFKGKSSVLEYLGRYTHKIAISNYRLIQLKDGAITFTYRDRNAGDVKRVMSLDVKTFLTRFVQHLLPYRFVKIRHYGIFSSRVKKTKLSQIRKSLSLEPEIKKEVALPDTAHKLCEEDIRKCRHCKQGTMVIIKILPPLRGSPRKLPAHFKVNVKT